MFKRKAQFSLEFLLTFIFIMSVVSVIIVILGNISIDVSLDEKRKEVDDFAGSILNEFSVMQTVEGGYYRNFIIESHFMERFNVTFEDGYLLVSDLQTYEDSESFSRNYLIPGNVNMSTSILVDGSMQVNLIKNFRFEEDKVNFFNLNHSYQNSLD